MPSWWDKKRHEWLYKSEMRKRQKQAQKYAKIQKKMSEEAAKKASSTGPTASQRYADWKRKRLLKKERQAEYWAQVQKKHPFLGWLKRHETKFFWLATLCVIAAAGLFITREMRQAELKAAAKAEEKRVMARVNGKPIYIETLIDRLFFAQGSGMLQELTEQEVVSQKATELGIELSADEKDQIEKLAETNPQWKVLAPRIEMTFLLRKLILKEVTEERKREVYRDFKEDVVTYEVSSIAFESKASATKFLNDLKAGKSADAAAVANAIDAKPPQKMGGLTRAQLNQGLGSAFEKAVAAAAPGQFSNPLLVSNSKYLILRIDAINTEFDEVRPAIEALIVGAESQQYMFNLMSEAKIDSPFIDPENAMFKKDTPGPFGTPTPATSPTPE